MIYIDIEKKTTIIKINKNTNAMRTNVPALVRDILHLQEKDKLIWIIHEDNTISIKKME